MEKRRKRVSPSAPILIPPTVRTSNRLFNTVNGFNTNPTLVLATAPASKFPWDVNFGSALVIGRSGTVERSG
jgi:hypothetical protein